MTKSILKSMLVLGYLVTLSFVLPSCGNQASTPEADAAPEEEPATITFTEEDLAKHEVKLGKLLPQSVQETVTVTGMVDVPPQQLATVNSLVPGYVSGLALYPGAKVAKGQTLCYLTHPDLIQMQQDYLDLQAKLGLVTTEWERQQSLLQGDATSKRQWQQAKTELASIVAKKAAISARLALIGIDVANLNPDNVVSRVAIKSPLGGYLKSVLVNTGKLVQPSEPMFEVIDLSHRHVELSIFEKDISAIKLGQKVTCSSVSTPAKFQAEVFLIGKNVDPVNRTINVHCHLAEELESLLPGMYVNAFIPTSTSQGYALSPDAIIETGSSVQAYFAEKKGDKWMLHPENVQVTNKSISRYVLQPTNEQLQKTWVLTNTSKLLAPAEEE